MINDDQRLNALTGLLHTVQHTIQTSCCGSIMDRAQLLDQIGAYLRENPYQHHRRVVCAANRYGDKLMLLGARHWDKQMHAQADRIGFNRSHYEQEEQGFIDQFGVFMSRSEAFQVAMAAGQIIRRVGGDEGTLYTENLY